MQDKNPERISAIHLYLKADIRKHEHTKKLFLKDLSFSLSKSSVTWPGGDPVPRLSKNEEPRGKVVLRFVWVFVANQLQRNIHEGVKGLFANNLSQLRNPRLDGPFRPVRVLFGHTSKDQGPIPKRQYCRVLDVVGRDGIINREILDPQDVTFFLKKPNDAAYFEASDEHLRLIYRDFDPVSLKVIPANQGRAPREEESSSTPESNRVDELTRSSNSIQVDMHESNQSRKQPQSISADFLERQLTEPTAEKSFVSAGSKVTSSIENTPEVGQYDRAVHQMAVEEAVFYTARFVAEELSRKDQIDEAELLSIQSQLPALSQKVEQLKAIKEADEENQELHDQFDEKDEELKRLNARRAFLSGKRELNLTTDASSIRNAIKHALTGMSEWADQLDYLDEPNKHKSKTKVRDVYVQLRMFVRPLAERFDDRIPDVVQLEEILDYTSKNIVLFGQPGAGKTTSMKKLFSILANRLCDGGQGFPLLIRLRQLNVKRGESFSVNSIHNAVADSLGLRFSVGNKLAVAERAAELAEMKRLFLSSILNELKCTLILDGFDEVATAGRDSGLAELRSLVQKANKARIVLTTRIGEFKETLENAIRFQIAPLQESQIFLFAKRWLKSEALANEFLAGIKQSPYGDAALRPLILTYLCAIYERSGYIPDRPSSIYQKIVQFLIEDWDESRGVRRISVFGSHGNEVKQRLLSHVAYLLTTKYESTSFGRRILSSVVKQTCESIGLPEVESSVVLSQLESHTGLLVQTSSNTFEFAHKSIQEFLSANYLIRLPVIEKRPNVLEKLANELAIATGMSSEPDQYLEILVLDRFLNSGLDLKFFDSFVERLCMEKPRFSNCGVVLLTLVSLWSGNGRAHVGVKLKSPEIDALERFNVNFGEVYRTDQVRKYLLTHFEILPEYDSDFHRLKRKDHASTYRIPSRLGIPTRIFEI